MDYSLCQASVFLSGIILLLVLYDIWCHYFVHLAERFRKSPALHLPDGLKLTGGIGQFHVHAHQSSCYPRFSPNFIPGAGVQLGEVIESLWVKLNDISGSTRAMSTAHRQEMLDDHIEDSNWMKLVRLGVFLAVCAALNIDVNNPQVPALVRKWKDACSEIGPAEEAFEALNRRTGADDQAAWTAQAEKAARERSSNYAAMDIYEVQSKKCAYSF